MVKATPINRKGEAIGEPKNFSDAQWKTMEESFGKHLAWKKIESPKEVQAPKAGNDVELISTKNAQPKSNKSKRS